MGRLLTESDDEPGAHWSRDQLWILGEPIRRNPEAEAGDFDQWSTRYDRGVSPPGFLAQPWGPSPITMPIAALPQITRQAAPLLGSGNSGYGVLPRPKPGGRFRQAKAHLAAVWPQIAEPSSPRTGRLLAGKRWQKPFFYLNPGGTDGLIYGEMYRKPLWVLMGMVGWCCSSRAPTWRACCWRAHPPGRGRWPCASPLARAAAGLLTALIESMLLSLMGLRLESGCLDFRPVSHRHDFDRSSLPLSST